MQGKEFVMIAKTFKGLESVLAEELQLLGANDIELGRRAVQYKGDLNLLYRSNIWLRTASRVLVPISTFRAKNADEVYEAVKKIDWEQYMDLTTTFCIDATVYSETFKHSLYVTYKVKDAICDLFNERYGKRPSVKLTDPDLYINIHIAEQTVTVSLDSSGDSLHKRGYRVAQTEAPINEALAAGMLMMAGWHGQSDFYDPMCGSGTLLIEAALIALNIPPGIYRKHYAFERWKNFNQDMFDELLSDDSEEREFAHHIYGSDAGYYAVQAALKNIRSAGVQKYVDVKQIRMEEIRHEGGTPGALVMLNPPYGERLAQQKDLLVLYDAIGTALKHQFTGATAWIISSNEEAMKQIGLKRSERIPLLNGELDCQFVKFELFKGEYKGRTKDGGQKYNVRSKTKGKIRTSDKGFGKKEYRKGHEPKKHGANDKPFARRQESRSFPKQRK